jgi:hypothetical protein
MRRIGYCKLVKASGPCSVLQHVTQSKIGSSVFRLAKYLKRVCVIIIIIIIVYYYYYYYYYIQHASLHRVTLHALKHHHVQVYSV